MKNGSGIWKAILLFAGGYITGVICTRALGSIASNSGSKFYGSEFAEFLKSSANGVAANSGSEFYSDAYIKAKFGSPSDNA